MKFTDSWEKIQTLNPREKVAQTHRLAYQIGQALIANDVDLSEFEVLIDILNRANYYSGNQGGYSHSRNLLVRRRLQALGLSTVKILNKVNGLASIESGLLGVADISHQQKINQIDFTPTNLRSLEQQGLCLSISTEGDGLFPIQLRLVEAIEPMLSEKEYRLVESSTEIVEINCPSGEIAVGDLFLLKETGIQLTLTPGVYKACAYVFDNHKDFRAHYFVLAKKTT